MKKIILILTAFLIISFLSSCSADDVDQNINQKENQNFPVYYKGDQSVLEEPKK